MEINGRLISDLPVPVDGQVPFGKTFTKSWQVQNTGDLPWGDDIRLVFLRGRAMTSQRELPVPPASPGEKVTITLSLRAPSRPESFAADWRLQDGNGRFFGDVLSLKIQTVNHPPPPPMKSNGRYLADITIPDGSELTTGQTFIKTWLVENTGETTWGEGYKLVFIGGDPMGKNRRFPLPPAAPNQKVNVSIPLTAPGKIWRVISRWRMQDDRGRFFGQQLFLDVFVVEGGQPAAPAEFNPASWRSTIWAITSIFESGKPEGNPAAYQTYDAGIISYGKHQATLGSGTLNQVVQAYIARSDSPTSRAIQTEYADRIANRDTSLRNDGRIKELLLAAAQEPAMSEAQDTVFDDRFYQPAVTQAQAHNVRTPLGLACLYDTQIQGGLFIVLPRVVEKLGGIVGDTGAVGEIDEAAFINTFLDEREARLLKLADQFDAKGNTANAQALRISTFRVKEYRRLLEAGNLALAGTLHIRGQTVAGIG